MLKAKSVNIWYRRKCGQVWRKLEPAGWWEWDNKELGQNGKMLGNVRSLRPTYGKETSTVLGS